MKGLLQLAIWVHLHGLTSNLVLWMRAGAVPLGAVAFCAIVAAVTPAYFVTARARCARPTGQAHARARVDSKALLKMPT